MQSDYSPPNKEFPAPQDPLKISIPQSRVRISVWFILLNLAE
jgi:hypothetical protein